MATVVALGTRFSTLVSTTLLRLNDVYISLAALGTLDNIGRRNSLTLIELERPILDDTGAIECRVTEVVILPR